MTKQKTNAHPLSQNFEFISLLRFAFPTMVTMLFMGLYTIVDTIFVSRLVNTNALSALNIACPIINLIVGLGTMLGAGGSAIVARKIGAKEEVRARSDFTLLILCGVLLGLIIAILGIIFLDKIVIGLGASLALYSYCYDYLLLLLLFTPASILQVLFQNLIITAGHPGLGMVLSISAGLVNILFDYLFIVLFSMGIQGAALGTGLGYLLPAMIGIGFFSTTKGNLHFQKPVLDLSVIIESCANGCSELVSQASAAVTTFLFNHIMMKLLGEDGVAAITIMIYTQFLLTALYIGFSMGVAPIFSYHYGSKNNQQLKKIFAICIRFILSISVFMFFLSMLFASPLVAIFSQYGTSVYLIARYGFWIFPFSFLFCGFNIFTSALFTALSNGKLSAIVSFLRTFGLITICLLIFPPLLGVLGVWLSVPVAEFLTMLVAVVLLMKYKISGFDS